MLSSRFRTVLRLTVVATALVLVSSTFAAAQSGAATAGAVATAKGYVQTHAGTFGATSADVGDLGVTSAYTSKHNGVTHVNLAQQYEGLEVFGAYATVNVKKGKVVFAGGDLESGLAVAADSALLGAVAAVEAAADELGLGEPDDLRVLSAAVGGAHESVVSDGGISEAAIPARLGWQPTAAGLRLAWQLEIDDASDVNYWNATIDAATGALLAVDDWTIVDDHEDLAATVHGGKLPAVTTASTTPARGFSLNPVTDGSCYRVYDLALESPNDGDRRLVCNPADATASPFGWHDTDGLPGAEFTITRGNNAHAYLDQDTNNAPDFGDTDGGAGLVFDFPVDLNEHAQAYRDAVVTNLFFGCNTFHDLLYLYGFDEPSGNFQANNYGRDPGNVGGPLNDYVRCEAADGNGTNNANFNTGAARMQMFLWPGNQFGSQNQVVVDGVGDFGAGWARFGPPAMVAGVSGAFYDAGNGCAPADYAGAPAGNWIAIVVGGTTGCQPIQKAREADAAGASAIVMSSGTSSTGIIASNSGGMSVASPDIPAVLVSTANGDAIRAALPASGTVRKNPNHPGIRDGDFENGIIFHEYGHGLSIRLTGGPLVSCLGGAEQQGEGWSDYVANVSMIDPALDDPQQPRGMGPYALFQADRHGNGIRPRPYTRDMTIQPTTYDSIKTNAWLTGSLATPHGVGHAWAAIMWDMTWDLIDKHGFAPNIYSAWNSGGNTRAMQYMVDGLKFQGCNPTFVRSRDAILASANTLGGGAPGASAGDACSIWASFSRRGVGFSAVGGGTGRDDGTEAFDTHPDCRRGFQVPVHRPYGELNVVDAGSAVPLRFSGSGLTGLDILMPTNSPFSRKVDCETLQVPSIGARITPREYPVDTETPGSSGLTRSTTGVYTYPWQTQEDWVDTCREVVVTRKDGIQHRAFFQVVAAE